MPCCTELRRGRNQNRRAGLYHESVVQERAFAAGGGADGVFTLAARAAMERVSVALVGLLIVTLVIPMPPRPNTVALVQLVAKPVTVTVGPRPVWRCWGVTEMMVAWLGVTLNGDQL